ncbi:MAG: hypothetical protein JSV21_03390 [Nitrospirota bacterium]|nr:MAG: hypothetical protein JSV21_03390 [Nitrospirota bacterium]
MKIFRVFSVMVVVLFISSCVYVHSPPPGHSEGVKKSPPPWAPAHGKRAKYRYRYYPSSFVYFDVDREMWFYMEGNRWRASVRLPRTVVIVSDDAIEIMLDTDEPHRHFHDHKSKYPPNEHKKERRQEHKYKKKHKYDDDDDDDDDDKRGKNKWRDD